MLSRTDVLRKLLEIRKLVYNKELTLKNPPSIEDIKIKKELDGLIIEVIGDFLSESDREFVDKIVLKFICGEITIEMALVAIKEIVMAYYTEEKGYNKSYQIEKEKNYEKKLAGYYQKRYR
ncbi:MAG: hypothetical protein GX175_11300 [Halanaerobiaceae bacterium]|jgi:hypothetical protein|nr:hypothetical protein [Halanaerobiaceae bacterium]